MSPQQNQPGEMLLGGRTTGNRNGVMTGSLWERRMKMDDVKGGIKVFDGENKEDDISNCRSKRKQGDGAVQKRRRWKPEIDKLRMQLRKVRSETLHTAKEEELAAGGEKTAPPTLGNPCMIRSNRTFQDDDNEETIKEQGDRKVCKDEVEDIEKEKIEIKEMNSVEKKYENRSYPSDLSQQIEPCDRATTSILFASSYATKKPQQLPAPPQEIEHPSIKSDLMYQQSAERNVFLIRRSAKGDAKSPALPSLRQELAKEFEHPGLDSALEQKYSVGVLPESFHPVDDDKAPPSPAATPQRVAPPPQPVAAPRTDHPANDPYLEWPRSCADDENKIGFKEDAQNKLQSLVDLTMWKDISKSALVFGLGIFVMVSTSYAKDVNFSLISASAYMGLLYLAVIFFYKSIILRGATDSEESYCRHMVGEAEAVWAVKIILPYFNELLYKLRNVFSGDPAVTMKLAVILFVLARCGGIITMWTMTKLAFIGVFTVPKLSCAYSSHLSAYGKFWLRSFSDVWSSSAHKKAIAAAIFIGIWNFSTTVARIWSVFVLIVGLRWYQQTAVRDECAEDVGEEDNEEQRRRCSAPVSVTKAA